MRRRRTNIDKQENVVSILWEFARKIQREPMVGCVITDSEGFRLSDKHIREALNEVMDNFGYAVLEVQ